MTQSICKILQQFTTGIDVIQAKKRYDHHELKKSQEKDVSVRAFRRLVSREGDPNTWLSELSKAEKDWFTRSKKDLKINEQGVLVKMVRYQDGSELGQCIVLPNGYRMEVIRCAHDDAGHFGQHKTHDNLMMRFTWPEMHDDIARYINSCPECQKGKGNRKGQPFQMKPIVTNRPNELLVIDFLKLSVSSEGHVGVIVMIDHFSKYARAIPLQEFTAVAAAEAICTHWICNHGIPERILSDQGSQFESAIFKEFLEVFGIQKSHSTAYHPQTNGLVERMNRTLIQMLRTECHRDQNRWHEHTARMMMAYNFAVHESTKYTPFRLLTGQEAQTPVWFLFPDWKIHKNQTHQEYVRKLVQEWERCVRVTRQNLRKAQIRQARNHDKKAIRGDRVQEGDLAIVFCDVVPRTGVKKLTRKWKGPYRCCAVLNDGRNYSFSNGLQAHAERVLRYESRPVELIVDPIDGNFILTSNVQGGLVQVTPMSVHEESNRTAPEAVPKARRTRSERSRSDDEDLAGPSNSQPRERVGTRYNLRPTSSLKSTFNENFIPGEEFENRRARRNNRLKLAEKSIPKNGCDTNSMLTTGWTRADEVLLGTPRPPGHPYERTHSPTSDEYELALIALEEQFNGLDTQTMGNRHPIENEDQPVEMNSQETSDSEGL